MNYIINRLIFRRCITFYHKVRINSVAHSNITHNPFLKLELQDGSNNASNGEENASSVASLLGGVVGVLGGGSRLGCSAGLFSIIRLGSGSFRGSSCGRGRLCVPCGCSIERLVLAVDLDLALGGASTRVVGAVVEAATRVLGDHVLHRALTWGSTYVATAS